MRRSYTYQCNRCRHLYSWVPETEDEKPQRCGVSIPIGDKGERKPCGGRGVRMEARSWEGTTT